MGVCGKAPVFRGLCRTDRLEIFWQVIVLESRLKAVARTARVNFQFATTGSVGKKESPSRDNNRRTFQEHMKDEARKHDDPAIVVDIQSSGADGKTKAKRRRPPRAEDEVLGTHIDIHT